MNRRKNCCVHSVQDVTLKFAVHIEKKDLSVQMIKKFS